jgi:uncharacterized protein (DUF433 family)
VPRRIPAREIVTDLRSGMRKRELMKKYALSAGDLQRAMAQIAEERRARGAAIARDVRDGLSNSDLMERYQLSEEGLRLAFAALVDEGLIGLFELGARNSRDKDSVVLNLRHGVRHNPAERISVCNQSRPEVQYALRDISEEGLSVYDIEARVSQTITMAILGDDGGDVAPFEFDAECRWTAPASSDKPTVSGFRITKISEENLAQLLAMIKRYA